MLLIKCHEGHNMVDATKASSLGGNGGMELVKFRTGTDITELGTWKSFLAAFGKVPLLGCCQGHCHWAGNNQCSLAACERGESKQHGRSFYKPSWEKGYVFVCLFFPHRHTQVWTFYLILRDGITFQGHSFVIYFPFKGMLCSSGHGKYLGGSSGEGAELYMECGSPHS